MKDCLFPVFMHFSVLQGSPFCRHPWSKRLQRTASPAVLPLVHRSEGVINGATAEEGSGGPASAGDFGLFLRLRQFCAGRARLRLLHMCIKKTNSSSGRSRSLRGSRGNPDHFARKHARSELLTAPINLNKIGRCSTYIFSG